MKRFCLFVVDGMSDFEYDVADYESGDKYAGEKMYFDSIEEVLRSLIHSLNIGEFSDENYYLVGDTLRKNLITF